MREAFRVVMLENDDKITLETIANLAALSRDFSLF